MHILEQEHFFQIEKKFQQRERQIGKIVYQHTIGVYMYQRGIGIHLWISMIICDDEMIEKTQVIRLGNDRAQMAIMYQQVLNGVSLVIY